MEKCETVKKLEAIASPAPSNWRELAEWRRNNRDWLRMSGAVALRIFMTTGGIGARAHVKESLGCDDLTASEILKGNKDLKLSEIVKLIGADGFFETMAKLKAYLDKREREEQETDYEEKRKSLEHKGKVTYCHGRGCIFSDDCLRKKMLDIDGWFNGIRTVDENSCIGNGLDMYKE